MTQQVRKTIRKSLCTNFICAALAAVFFSACGGLKRTREVEKPGKPIYGPVIPEETHVEKPRTDQGVYGPAIMSPLPGSPQNAFDRSQIQVVLAGASGVQVFAYVGAIKELRRAKIRLGGVYTTQESLLAPALFAGSKNLNKLDWFLFQLKKPGALTPETKNTLLNTLKEEKNGLYPWASLKLYTDFDGYGFQKLIATRRTPLLVLRLSSGGAFLRTENLNPTQYHEVIIPVEGIDPERAVDQGEAIYRGSLSIKDSIQNIQALLKPEGM